jgi:hypothetical protein
MEVCMQVTANEMRSVLQGIPGALYDQWEDEELVHHRRVDDWETTILWPDIGEGDDLLGDDNDEIEVPPLEGILDGIRVDDEGVIKKVLDGREGRAITAGLGKRVYVPDLHGM